LSQKERKKKTSPPKISYLEGSSLRGGGGDDDGVLEGIVLLEGLDELGDSRTLLANGDVDAEKLLLVIGRLVDLLLVEDGVEGDGSLAGLTITNNQLPDGGGGGEGGEFSFSFFVIFIFKKYLTLATTNGDHRVDGLETSLHGLLDRLAGDNAGGLDLDTGALVRVDGALFFLFFCFVCSLRICMHVAGWRNRTLPSMGLPRASTTRPRRPAPTGTSTIAPVR